MFQFILPSLVVGHIYWANGLKSPGLHISTNPSNRLLGQDGCVFCFFFVFLSSIMDPTSDVNCMMLCWRALYLSCAKVIFCFVAANGLRSLGLHTQTHKCNMLHAFYDSFLNFASWGSSVFSKGNHLDCFMALIEVQSFFYSVPNTVLSSHDLHDAFFLSFAFLGLCHRVLEIIVGHLAVCCFTPKGNVGHTV